MHWFCSLARRHASQAIHQSHLSYPPLQQKPLSAFGFGFCLLVSYSHYVSWPFLWIGQPLWSGQPHVGQQVCFTASASYVCWIVVGVDMSPFNEILIGTDLANSVSHEVLVGSSSLDSMECDSTVAPHTHWCNRVSFKCCPLDSLPCVLLPTLTLGLWDSSLLTLTLLLSIPCSLQRLEWSLHRLLMKSQNHLCHRTHVIPLLRLAPWTLLGSVILKPCWEDSSQTSTTPVPFYPIPSHPMEDDSHILRDTEASPRALLVRQSQAGHTLQLRIVEFLSSWHRQVPQERWQRLSPPSCSRGVPTSWFHLFKLLTAVLHSSAARQQEQHSHSLAEDRWSSTCAW